MKKCFYVIAALVLAASSALHATPGDTTWVQANNRRLDNGSGYGNYDTSVAFPSGTTTYRKIYMIFNLGEYPCPTGTQYCHQWDYTVTNYLMTPTDTVEISRLITPYANSGVPRFPATWNKDYVFDVTDYAPLLKNNAVSRIFYSGYSAGFTANVRFAFIEGTPDRNVLGIQKLWSGSYLYGNASDLIDNRVTSKNRTAPAGTDKTDLKWTITGHGSDNNGCCEFDSHNYSVLLNNATIATKAIWKDDCGKNQLYPQGGTWIYDRANWCPGELITVNSYTLPGIVPGTPYDVDVNFDAYTAGNTNYGSYTVNGVVIYYGPMNKTSDMSVEDIISPTKSDNHFRENPSGPSPVIRVRNNGSSPAIGFNVVYGVKDSVQQTFSVTGNLAPQRDTILTLPALTTLTNMSLGAASGSYTFNVELVPLTSFTDNDYTNNKLSSTFVVAPAWSPDLVITMKTNSEGTLGINQGVSETSWVITDMNNNIVASRTNLGFNTLYVDTLSIQTPGFYKLQIADGGCDGLHWWVWDQTPSAGVTAGYFYARRKGTVTNLPMNGYTFSGSYGHDFGCGYTQYFTTKGWNVGVNNVNTGSDVSMEAYPNPAKNEIAVMISGLANAGGHLALMDMLGRTVSSMEYQSGIEKMDVSAIPNGVYQLTYTNKAENALHTTQRVVIAK